MQNVYRSLGLTWFVHKVWIPYRHLPIPPTERSFRSFLERLIQPGWSCIDVGANYGMMTEVMADRVGPSGAVTAFEAHPFNASLLDRRLRLVGLRDRVTIENKAVSDGTLDKLVLYAGRRRSPNEWNIVGHDVQGRSTKAVMEIPALSLDRYCGTSPVHLIKIDVEGAEVGVIAGMRSLMAEQKPICLVEFHNPEAWLSRKVFVEAGYQIFELGGRPVPVESEWMLHVLLWPPGAPPQASLFAAPES